MATQGKRQWHYCWEKVEEPLKLNRNSGTFNGFVTFFNLFNLAWSGWFALDATALPSLFRLIFESSSAAAMGGTLGMRLALGWFPFLFSVVFFLVPLIRAVLIHRENKARQARNERRRALRRIVEQYALPPQEVPLRPEPGPWRAQLDEAVRLYEGDLELDDEGLVGYRFPRLREELQDVARLRAAVDEQEFALGEIAYSSEEGG